MCKQRTSLHGLHILSERLCGNSFSPKLFSNPITDFPFTQHFPTDDPPRHLTLAENCFKDDSVVSHDLGPVLHEGFPIPRWERRHRGRFGIELLLEEDGQVGFGYVAELNNGYHGFSRLYDEIKIIF